MSPLLEQGAKFVDEVERGARREIVGADGAQRGFDFLQARIDGQRRGRLERQLRLRRWRRGASTPCTASCGRVAGMRLAFERPQVLARRGDHLARYAGELRDREAVAAARRAF